MSDTISLTTGKLGYSSYPIIPFVYNGDFYCVRILRKLEVGKEFENQSDLINYINPTEKLNELLIKKIKKLNPHKLNQLKKDSIHPLIYAFGTAFLAIVAILSYKYLIKPNLNKSKEIEPQDNL